MARMSELGWICVTINYSRSPRNAFPSHIVDVKRAIAWVKANIAKYGGRPGVRRDHRGDRPVGT